MKHFNTTLALLVTAALASSAQAGTPMAAAKEVIPTTGGLFDQGRMEFQSATGALFSFGDSPSMDYSTSTYRLGRMLGNPAGEGWLRGNNELMLQLTYGGVFHGPGNGLGIATVLWRYNFIQPDTRWVPFVQVGVGAAYNDIYKEKQQTAIKAPWVLDLEAAVGVRYLINDRWSANVELNYRHTGYDSLGASIGLGRHF